MRTELKGIRGGPEVLAKSKRRRSGLEPGAVARRQSPSKLREEWKEEAKLLRIWPLVGVMGRL